jgi:hypothetical protein
MPNSTDPIALYGALGAVGAITTALQTTAVFASYGDVGAIEQAFDQSRPATQERTDAKSEAGTRLRTTLLLNAPGIAVNGCVIAAWGDVTFVRAHVDWVLILPWIGVLLTFLFLVGATVSLRRRLVAVRDEELNAG